MDLNWADIAILVIVGLSAIIGLWRGFVREVLSVLVWIAALLVAIVYAPHLAPFFSGFVDNDTARYVLAFAVLCFITLILGGLINHFMSKLMNLAGLQFIDRLLGSVFGVLRGVIVVAIIVFFATAGYNTEIWWTESEFIPLVVELVEWARLFVEDFRSQA